MPCTDSTVLLRVPAGCRRSGVVGRTTAAAPSSAGPRRKRTPRRTEDTDA
jgi:hypothetical protein